MYQMHHCIRRNGKLKTNHSSWCWYSKKQQDHTKSCAKNKPLKTKIYNHNIVSTPNRNKFSRAVQNVYYQHFLDETAILICKIEMIYYLAESWK